MSWTYPMSGRQRCLCCLAGMAHRSTFAGVHVALQARIWQRFNSRPIVANRQHTLHLRRGSWSAVLISWFLFSGAAAAASEAAADCEPDQWPEPALLAPKHTDTDAFVNQILAQMSLEEKIGQMIQADIGSIAPSDLATYKLGSILAGGNAAPGGNVRTTPRAWLDLVDAFAAAARIPGSAEHVPIPIFFGIDAVHGDAKIIGATIFPHNVGLGAANDPELLRRIGKATAEEVAATGINWTFAPTVAVARDARWGRSFESYSENPELVARYAAAMVTGLQGRRGSAEFMAPGSTLSSVKHFIGDGGTTDGRDQGDTDASAAQLRDVHGRGYAAAIDAGALIVMASYNSWHGVKLHADHCLLTGVLKDRLGFDGFVVGDWNAHEQIPGCTKYSCPAAILAGVDMLMAPDSWKPLYENTLAQVRAGTIPQARIDDAVARILRVKALVGLFGAGTAPAPRIAGQFERLGSRAHRELAREAVRRSLVLLKNDRGTLPLAPAGRFLVVGAVADDIGTQCGGWTIDWQGDHNLNVDFPGATSIYAGIKAAVTAGGGSVAWSPDGRFADKPDAAIVVFGESPYAEFEGDRETVEFSPADRHHLELMRRLRRAGIPVVAVFLSGRALWVNPELNAADAFVAAWLPGSEGEGVADLLFRARDGSVPYDFTGKLSFSWPATGMPVRYDTAGKVSGSLFPLGYGLSYADAAPRLPRLSERAELPADKQVSGTLFHAAHVTAPWSIFVSDRSAEVRLTTQRQESPLGVLSVTRDRAGAVASWSAGEPGIFRISGRPADYRAEAAAGWRIVARYQVLTKPKSPVRIGVRCAAPTMRLPLVAAAAAPAGSDAALCNTAGGAMLDLTAALRLASLGAWRTLSIPLSCLSSRGADLANVAAPFAIETAGQFSIAIAEVRIEQRGARDACDGSP